mmetsp:Transcript_28554/g.66493  ORF Transcript_28554/g.66493 Transcript_28554/m.66493 type:complete len:253 (+) Transcript_28554:174-932(+)
MPSGAWLCNGVAGGCCLLHGGVALPLPLALPGAIISAAISPPLACTFRSSSSPCFNSCAAISCGSWRICSFCCTGPAGSDNGASAGEDAGEGTGEGDGAGEAAVACAAVGSATGAPVLGSGAVAATPWKPRGVGKGGRDTEFAWRSSSSPRRNTAKISPSLLSAVLFPPAGCGKVGTFAGASAFVEASGPSVSCAGSTASRCAPGNRPPWGCGSRGGPFCVPLEPRPKAALQAPCTVWLPFAKARSDRASSL